MPSPSERELVERAQAGSADAVGELFARHWTGAWRVAYGVTGSRAMADDVAQDAFERAIRGLPTFDRERPFAPWLHRIVVNRAYDVLRRERRLGPIDDDAPDPAAPDAGDAAGDAVTRARVRAEVARLPADRRAVVTLHHWLGYPTAEIAELLGVPVGTVHSRLSRAVAELRRRLEVSDAERPR